MQSRTTTECPSEFDEYQMRPGLYRKTMQALRTGIYRPDHLMALEVLMELSNFERYYIWKRLDSWERSALKEIEQMEI